MGDFVAGGFCHGGLCRWWILSWGLLSRGIMSWGILTQYPLQEVLPTRKEHIKKVWNNVTLVEDGAGGYRAKVTYLYQKKPEGVFAPQNSNYKQAVAMSQNMIRQLKKKNQLDMFKEEIQKTIELGTLKKVSSDELE